MKSKPGVDLGARTGPGGYVAITPRILTAFGIMAALVVALASQLAQAEAPKDECTTGPCGSGIIAGSSCPGFEGPVFAGVVPAEVCRLLASPGAPLLLSPAPQQGGGVGLVLSPVGAIDPVAVPAAPAVTQSASSTSAVVCPTQDSEIALDGCPGAPGSTRSGSGDSGGDGDDGDDDKGKSQRGASGEDAEDEEDKDQDGKG
ncbi:MAG: hypothetical protein ACRDIU_02920 [Actinomycetota bacterium]